MDEAIAFANSQKSPNYSLISKLYNVDRSTLSRRHRGVTVARKDYIDDISLLSQQQQQTLIEYVKRLTLRGLPPTPAMVRNFGAEICGKLPGKNWAHEFISTHREKLGSAYLKGFDLERKKANNPALIRLYFELVS